MRSTMAKVDHWAHALIGDTFADEYTLARSFSASMGFAAGAAMPTTSLTPLLRSASML